MSKGEMLNKQDVLICGAGGYAKATVDLLLLLEKYHIVGILDDNAQLHHLS